MARKPITSLRAKTARLGGTPVARPPVGSSAGAKRQAVARGASETEMLRRELEAAQARIVVLENNHRTALARIAAAMKLIHTLLEN